MHIWALCSMIKLFSGLPCPWGKYRLTLTVLHDLSHTTSSASALATLLFPLYTAVGMKWAQAPLVLPCTSFQRAFCSAIRQHILQKPSPHFQGQVRGPWASCTSPILRTTLYCHCPVTSLHPPTVHATRTGTRCVVQTFYPRLSHSAGAHEYWLNEIIIRL